MKIKSLLFGLLAVALVATSCRREDSDAVDQDKIHVRYVLEYNATQDITYARAQFRFSRSTGTILELVDNASISFNGDAMIWNNALAYYEKEYAGLVSTGAFSYTDVDGNTFTNTATVPPSIEFPNPLGPISISGAYEMFWIGNNIASDENVWVSIAGDNTTVTGQTFAEYGVGSSSIIFSQAKLQDLGTGTANMFMDRNHEVSATDVTSAGGVVVGRYKAPNVENIQFTY